MKLKKKVTKKAPVRKLTAETQNRGRDGGNKQFKSLSDEYQPEVVSEKKILVRDYKNTSGKVVKIYLVVKVQRFDKEDGDGLGLPYVFLQLYQESERYTGYLRGKSVHFPLEMMYEVLDLLTEVSDTCDKLKIE